MNKYRGKPPINVWPRLFNGDGIINENVERRFYKKTDRAGSGCWPWLAGKNTHGYPYGTFSIGGEMQYAHRVAWQIANNSLIPEGKVVCHRCDNPSCVNPAHLFLASQAENNRDRASKGRSATPAHRPPIMAGERNPIAKLNDEKVREIIIRLAAGQSKRSIAIEFGISKTNAYLIASGKAWAHVPRD